MSSWPRTYPGRQDLRTPFIVAHRANAARVPENSLAGIRANRALGTELVELDVRRSLGGTPFLHHNWSLGRKRGNGNWPVRLTPGPLLRRMVLENDEPLPTLAEALDLIASDPSMPGPALHAKDQGGVRAALSAVRHRRLGPRTWMWVHGAEAVRLTRSMAPDAHVTLVEGSQKTRREFSGLIDTAIDAGADAVSLPWWALDPEVMAEAVAKHIGMVAVVHDLDTVVPLVRSGLSGVITDDPETVAAILRDAGLRPQWISRTGEASS